MLDCGSAFAAAFGDPPWLLWIYDVVATGLTVVLSEPRDGVYSFVESLLARDMESWRWFHVGLSTLTSAVIVAGLVLALVVILSWLPPSGRRRCPASAGMQAGTVSWSSSG